MSDHLYIVATIKPWNVKIYQDVIRYFPGEWHLITDPGELTSRLVNELKPKYIFFPHWSEIVPLEILNLATCVCFHETDLPYGRGGSPLQNLIANGHRETVITAIKMVEELDAGPIYLKEPLSLDGLAEEIYIRTSHLIAGMIRKIITENPDSYDQTGEPTVFKRRKPHQSRVPLDLVSLDELFDHLRMLDATGYPKAFFEIGGFRFEISRPSLKVGEILADIRIAKIQENADV